MLRARLNASGQPIALVPVAAILVASIRLHFLNVLATRDDLVLVTGDKLLLGDPAMQERIIQPQTLMARLTH